jgi:hypothetical protein
MNFVFYVPGSAVASEVVKWLRNARNRLKKRFSGILSGFPDTRKNPSEFLTMVCFENTSLKR